MGVSDKQEAYQINEIRSYFYLGRWYIGIVMNDYASTIIDLISLQQRKQMFQWPSTADIL